MSESLLRQVEVLLDSIWGSLRSAGLVLPGESARVRAQTTGDPLILVEVSSESGDGLGWGVDTTSTATVLHDLLDGICDALVDLRWGTWPPCPVPAHQHPGQLAATLEGAGTPQITVACPRRPGFTQPLGWVPGQPTSDGARFGVDPRALGSKEGVEPVHPDGGGTARGR